MPDAAGEASAVNDRTPYETSVYWDGVADEWTDEPRDALWREHADAINAALLDRWLPGGRVHSLLKTDLFNEAVATGLYPTLRQRAEKITGFDISPGVVRAAVARYPELAGFTADVRDLPFETDTFDAVVSLSTLDHFDSLDAIRTGIEEIKRVLARRGTLIITLDNFANPVVALRNRLPYPFMHRLGVVPYYVGPTYSGRGLTGLLRAADFELQDLTYILHCPRFLGLVASRLAERRAGAGTQRQLLDSLARWERLERWPARALSGYFVAVRAVKR
jgi:SAM-dependent methyltransferase